MMNKMINERQYNCQNYANKILSLLAFFLILTFSSFWAVSAYRNMASPLIWAMLWPLTIRGFIQYTASCTRPGRVCGAFQ